MISLHTLKELDLIVLLVILAVLQTSATELDLFIVYNDRFIRKLD